MCANLKKAKFVVSPKSVLSPSIKMDFIGKIFNTDKRLTCNGKGLLDKPPISLLTLVEDCGGDNPNLGGSGVC